MICCVVVCIRMDSDSDDDGVDENEKSKKGNSVRSGTKRDGVE